MRKKKENETKIDNGDIDVVTSEASDPIVIAWDIADSKTINPSLDYFNGKMYISQTLPFYNTNADVMKKTCVITSDRKLIVLDIETIKQGIEGIRIAGFPDLIDNRWSTTNIREFLECKNRVPSYLEIFNAIHDDIESRIEFKDKRYCKLVTLWIMATYFFPIFEAFPFLYLMGCMQSGKTNLLLITSCMAFNARPSVGMTTATLFRLAENNRSSILIDEVEGNQMANDPEFRAMMLASYKKGLKVPRSRKLSSGRMVVDEFAPYSPKMLVNIRGLDDVLEDRAITIIMERGTNPEKLNKGVDLNNPLYQKIRDNLYLLALLYCQEVDETAKLVKQVQLVKLEKNIGSNDKKQIVNDNTIDDREVSTLSTLSTLKNPPKYASTNIYIVPTQTTLSSLKPSFFVARNMELALPVITMSSLCSPEIMKDVVDLFEEIFSIKKEENIAESTENTLLVNLVKLVNEVKYYKMSNITSLMVDTMEGRDEKWLNTRWVGKAIKRLGISKSKRRVGTGVEVLLDPVVVRKKAQDMGIDISEMHEEIMSHETNDDIIRRIVKERSALLEHGAPYNVVVEEAKNQGVANVEKIIDKLMQMGVLFEPKQGYIKIL